MLQDFEGKQKIIARYQTSTDIALDPSKIAALIRSSRFE
jgi:hypothetical protein